MACAFVPIERDDGLSGYAFRCETCGSEFEDALAGQIAVHGQLLNSFWCGNAPDPDPNRMKAAA